MDFDCIALTLLRGNQNKCALFVLRRHRLLLVTWLHILLIRQKPNLQKVRLLARRVIEFTMLYTSTRTHALHISGWDAFDVT